MSRTRKIIGATSIGYLQQVATLVVGLWLTPFLLRHVGQHDLGLWLVAGQVLGYLALVDLGILAILPREVAYASAQPGAGERIAGLVKHVRALVRWQVVALSAACVAFLVFIPVEWRSLRWPLAGVFAVFVGAYPLRIPSAVLQGLQELPYLAKAQLAGWVVGTSATVVLVLSGWKVSALVVGWSVTLLLPALTAAWGFRRRFPSIEHTTTGPVGQGYFGRSVWVSAGQIGQVFLSGSDVLVIGKLLGAAAVVPYACTAKLVTIFANYPQLLIHSAQPALTELRLSESKERLVAVAQAMTQGMLVMSGALVVLVVAINRFFVTWWIGSEQYAGPVLTIALAVMMLLRHWNLATIYTLFCFGYERQLSLVALADGVVTIAATAWLIPHFGLMGAPVASAIGAVLVGLPLNVRSAAREIGVSVWDFLWPCAPLAGVITAVVALAAAGNVWMDGSRFANAGLCAVVSLGVYAAAMTPFIASGPLRPYAFAVLSMIDSRLQKRAAAPA